MLLERIIIKNYKTYRDLELDLTVQKEKPIILVGGGNGGGKTTLFEAIYSALYGLEVRGEKDFTEKFNAGNLENRFTEEIKLEIRFSGLILGKEQKYIISRAYKLNDNKAPVESVKLNLNGDIFTYGTHTPISQKQTAEREINKIIKANLPQELSRYFLFDATETKNLLEENQLARVIKENIENVMGFRKFQQLAKAANKISDYKAAEKIKLEKDRNEYLKLVKEKGELNDKKDQIDLELERHIDFSVEHKLLYDDLIAGQNQDTAIQTKIKQLEQKLGNIQNREANYYENLENFIREFDLNVIIPKIAKELRNELKKVVNERKAHTEQKKRNMETGKLREVIADTLDLLKKRGLLTQEITVDEVLVGLEKLEESDDQSVPFDFLDQAEINALDKFLQTGEKNSFTAIHKLKVDIELAIQDYDNVKLNLDDIRDSVSNRDYSLIKQYNDNENEIERLENEKAEIEKNIRAVEKSINNFDIHDSNEADPGFEAVKKLKELFVLVSDSLLQAKKKRIEVRLKEDLNINLLPYRDQIAKVELGDSMQNFAFTMYHNSGNIIPLGQLNAASKQMVVQCLLKALHEFGDYDPPVMIDTVMGALDRESRNTVLEHYFPKLAHQTILLSSDTEITPDNDFKKISAFVSKVYTLIRIPDQQRSVVENNYFGLEQERIQ